VKFDVTVALIDIALYLLYERLQFFYDLSTFVANSKYSFKRAFRQKCSIKAYFHYRCALRCVARDRPMETPIMPTPRNATQRAAVMEIWLYTEEFTSGPKSDGSQDFHFILADCYYRACATLA